MSAIAHNRFQLIFSDAAKPENDRNGALSCDVLTTAESQELWEYARSNEMLDRLVQCLQQTTTKLVQKWNDDSLTCSDKTAILNYLVQSGAILVKELMQQSNLETLKQCDGGSIASSENADESDETQAMEQDDPGMTPEEDSSSCPEEFETEQGESDVQGNYQVTSQEEPDSYAEKEGEDSADALHYEDDAKSDDVNSDESPHRRRFVYNWTITENDSDSAEEETLDCVVKGAGDIETACESGGSGQEAGSCGASVNSGNQNDKINAGNVVLGENAGDSTAEGGLTVAVSESSTLSDKSDAKNGENQGDASPFRMMQDLIDTKLPNPTSGTLPGSSGLSQLGQGPNNLSSNIVVPSLNVQQSVVGGVASNAQNFLSPAQPKLTPVMLGNQLVFLSSPPILNNQSNIAVNNEAVKNKINGPIILNCGPQPPPTQQMLVQPTPGYLSGLINCLPMQGLPLGTPGEQKPNVGSSGLEHLAVNQTPLVQNIPMPVKSEDNQPVEVSDANLEVATVYKNDGNTTFIKEETLFRSQDMGNNFQGHHSLQVWGNLLQCGNNLPRRIIEGNSNLKLTLKTSGDITNTDVLQTPEEVSANVLIQHVSACRFVYAIERQLPVDGTNCLVDNCGAKFKSRKALGNHVTQMHPIGKYVCGVCNEDIEFQLLSKHMVHHARNDKPFNAGVYDRSVEGAPSFENKGNIRKVNVATSSMALNKISDKPEYQCEFCGRVFTTSVSCLNHRKVHTGVEKHRCKVCQRCFVNAIQLECHMRVHTGIYPHHCPVCNKGFSKRGNLQHHLPVHNKEKAFQCTACNIKLKTAESLESHMKMHTGDKPFQCEECGKRFVRRSHLRVHSKIHSDERPFMCEQCGKRFRTNQRLNTHRQCHSGVKPHKCDVCDRRFMWKRDLDRHIDSHKGHKQYMCDLCGKTFMRTEALKIHQRLHTQERPYKCDNCGKGFNQKVQLQLHNRSRSCYNEKSKSKSNKQTIDL